MSASSTQFCKYVLVLQHSFPCRAVVVIFQCLSLVVTAMSGKLLTRKVDKEERSVGGVHVTTPPGARVLQQGLLDT